MPISLILTPFDHFHFRPALAVKCIHDLRICLNNKKPRHFTNIVFFPSALFLCLRDSECWIKLVLPPLLHFLSTSQYRHLNYSLSEYCAQSPTRSPFPSFSPNHPMCQLINLLALLPDILPKRQLLKSKISCPMSESVTVEQCLYHIGLFSPIIYIHIIR